MSGQHTPGPWEVVSLSGCSGPFSIRMAYISESLNENKTYYGVRQIGRIDDARLIAAAPELLEALLEAHRALRKYEWYDNPKSGWASEHDKHVRHLVDSAIAKATGEAA